MRARLLIGISILIAAGSCARHENLSKDCKVPADQKDSFIPRLSDFPVDVIADDQFNSQERDSISATVREWNAMGSASAGVEIFRLRFSSISASLRTLDPHQCGSEMGGDRSFYVVREQSQSHWNSIGFIETTPGATIRCYSGGGDDVERQIIYMNPALLTSGQFDQAFAHEFGHSIGLEHSCSGGEGSANYIGCKSLKGGSSHPYAQAVMYPILKAVSANYSSYGNASNSSGAGSRISAVLQNNDLIRGECVVGPTD